MFDETQLRYITDLVNDEITSLADMLDDIDTGDDAAEAMERLETIADKISAGSVDFRADEMRAIRDLLADEAVKLAAILGTGADEEAQATEALDAIQPAIGLIDEAFEADAPRV